MSAWPARRDTPGQPRSVIVWPATMKPAGHPAQTLEFPLKHPFTTPFLEAGRVPRGGGGGGGEGGGGRGLKFEIQAVGK